MILIGGALPAICRLGQCMIDEEMSQIFERAEIGMTDSCIKKEERKRSSRLRAPRPSSTLLACSRDGPLLAPECLFYILISLASPSLLLCRIKVSTTSPRTSHRSTGPGSRP
jgi:hypothetical protein